MPRLWPWLLGWEVHKDVLFVALLEREELQFAGGRSTSSQQLGGPGSAGLRGTVPDLQVCP